MYKKIIYRALILAFTLKVLLCVSTAKEYDLGHTKSGTSYGETGVKKYASVKHGPDGSLFLDPYFLPFIQNVEGLKILDAGCGAAPWAIYAAKNGAFVDGIDIQEHMITKGKEEALKAGLENRVTLRVGNVNILPYQNYLFDKALSINVGCNLPELNIHLAELARVLKEKGRAIITAPASFDVVFTSGNRALPEIMKDIEEALNKINAHDPSSIKEHLSSMHDIYRATFIEDDGKLKLITNENDLDDGQTIWRKLPGMVVPNYYHSEYEYINEATKAGFNVVKIEKPKFSDENEFSEYNEKSSEEFKLGEAYTSHNVFIIMELEKS